VELEAGVRLTRGSLRRDGVVASAEISEELASARRNHAGASFRLSIDRSVATTLTGADGIDLRANSSKLKEKGTEPLMSCSV